MAKPGQTLLLLLFSSVLLLPLAVAVDLDLFNHSKINVPVCSRTDYPILCVYAAYTYGRKYPALDAMSLLAMHVEMATDHTKSARAVAQLFLALNRPLSRHEKGAFDVCITMFSDALDDLQTGLDAVRKGDAGTANSMLSAAITYYTTCDDAFAEIPASNPMAKQDYILSKMVSNALALGQVVLGQGPGN